MFSKRNFIHIGINVFISTIILFLFCTGKNNSTIIHASNEISDSFTYIDENQDQFNKDPYSMAENEEYGNKIAVESEKERNVRAEVNIFTDINKAQVFGMKQAINSGIVGAFDIVPYEIDAIQNVVEKYMRLFSSVNHVA